MSGSRVHFCPLLVFILFPVSFVITYAVSLSNGQIYAFYSYISDTGTHVPASCIFAQLLNIVGLIMAIVIYIRYKQIEEYLRLTNDLGGMRANWWVWILGCISALGVSVVGCFQETNVLIVHFIGAFMCFLGGAIWLCIQSYYSFKMLPLFGSRKIAIMRTILGISCILLFIISIVAGFFSFTKYTGTNATKWRKEDGGWELHVISVVTEWVMAALFDLYILSFMGEFRKLSFASPKFTFSKSELTKPTPKDEKQQSMAMLPEGETKN